MTAGHLDPLAGAPTAADSPEDRALRILLDRIITCELPPGAPLHQVALARELGVNRHHVRDMLAWLANERLVRMRPYATATVAPLSAHDFQELHELRLALESLAVRRALPHLTGPDIAVMRECVGLIADPPTPEARLRAHELFHSMLYRKADRPWMVALVDRSRQLSRRYLALLYERIGWPSTAASHERILEAVERGDERLVTQLIAEHGRQAHEPVFQYLSRFDLAEELG